MEKQLADHSIPIGSIKEILGYNIRNKLAAFVLIFCFCDFVLNAIFNRIMGEFVGQAFYKMLIVDMVLLLHNIFICNTYMDTASRIYAMVLA